MPYAIKGHEMWERMGDDVGFKRTGGYTLAFNDREADLLYDRMTQKREAGADITFVSPEEIAASEPRLAKKSLQPVIVLMMVMPIRRSQGSTTEKN